MNLEEYFKREGAEGKIDFILRAETWDGVTRFYVHPMNRDGLTTPNLQVVGDQIIWPEPFTLRSES